MKCKKNHMAHLRSASTKMVLPCCLVGSSPLGPSSAALLVEPPAKGGHSSWQHRHGDFKRSLVTLPGKDYGQESRGMLVNRDGMERRVGLPRPDPEPIWEELGIPAPCLLSQAPTLLSPLYLSHHRWFQRELFAFLGFKVRRKSS
jgi:hypothetical protein